MASKIKQLLSDTIVYGLMQILGRFLTFLLTPLYTNYLTKTDNSDIAYVWSILAFLNILYSFGMENAFFRFHKKEDKEYSKMVFSNSYLIMAFVSIFSTILIMANASWISNEIIENPLLKINNNFIMIVALIPMIDALSMLPFAVLRINHRAKKFAISRFVSIIATIIFNYLFIVELQIGTIGAAYAQLIGSLIVYLLLLPEFVSYFKFSIDKLLLKEMFYFGLPTIPAGLSAIILQIGDKPILKELTDANSLAVYNANYRLGIPMMLAVTAFDYAWKPFYMNNFRNADSKEVQAKVLTYFTILCSFIFLIVSFFMESLVKIPIGGGNFIQKDYWEGIGIIPIILIAYYFNGLYSNISAGFNISKQTKYLSYSIGIAALVNVVANIFLIPIMNYYGAALATLIAYITSFSLLFYYSQSIYPIKYQWGKVGLILCITCLSYFVGTYLHVEYRIIVLILQLITIYFTILKKEVTKS
jgi:O-antigen/teichoic acid export membrane protein